MRCTEEVDVVVQVAKKRFTNNAIAGMTISQGEDKALPKVAAGVIDNADLVRLTQNTSFSFTMMGLLIFTLNCLLSVIPSLVMLVRKVSNLMFFATGRASLRLRIRLIKCQCARRVMIGKIGAVRQRTRLYFRPSSVSVGRAGRAWMRAFARAALQLGNLLAKRRHMPLSLHLWFRLSSSFTL
jgi:hypothetical protein